MKAAVAASWGRQWQHRRGGETGEEVGVEGEGLVGGDL